jgi:Ca2+-binding RTX toxin-like protein
MLRLLRASGLALVIGVAAIGSVSPDLLGATVSAAHAPTCNGLTATIVGTSGDDVITGTPGNDVIAGLDGNDVVRGGLGNDVICGGAGEDTLFGQGGNDTLFGDQDDDILDGGEGGCCNMSTNTGDDTLFGGQGDDELHTSDFPTVGNTLYGEQGADRLFLWSGGWGYGGNGDDEIMQYSRDAWLDGGNGNDFIIDWNDNGLNAEVISMLGGNGDDELVSQDPTSTVTMDGGRGADTCTGGASLTHCEG